MADDLQDYPILCVDDDEANLITLKYAFEGRFRILTARSGDEALEMLVRHPIAVLLCDQRMPNMSGVELCKRALELRPDVTRMLITAYSDVDAVISAINLGQVTRFLLKPWRPEEIDQVLRSAIEIARLRRTITDLEKQLISAFPQRLTLVASAAVVHELSNPLAALTMAAAEASGTIGRILGSIEDSSESASIVRDVEWLKELHDEIGPGLDQLNAMLRRMREGARAASIEGQCDVKLVAESAARLMRRQIEPHARVQVICDASVTVGIDPSALAEIVINLLLNASQSMDAAGLCDRTIRVEGRREGSRAVLVISDDGPGISAENLGRLFDGRFSTRGEKGGLGLLIVQDLVRRAGGTIYVDSDLGRGTRFEVRLPQSLDSLMENTPDGEPTDQPERLT
jgi:signal transduction histidine kinase